MKKFLLYLSLGILSALAVGFGTWMGLTYKALAFVQLPGLYDCTPFGVPDSSFNKIEISSEFKMVSTNSEGVRFLIGELRNYDGKRGRIELTTEAIHYPSLTINPIEKHLIEGTARGLYFIQLGHGSQTRGAFCRLIQKLEAAL